MFFSPPKELNFSIDPRMPIFLGRLLRGMPHSFIKIGGGKQHASPARCCIQQILAGHQAMFNLLTKGTWGHHVLNQPIFGGLGPKCVFL
jgi:hypothetical protein